jgi:hypothetical protein
MKLYVLLYICILYVFKIIIIALIDLFQKSCFKIIKNDKYIIWTKLMYIILFKRKQKRQGWDD